MNQDIKSEQIIIRKRVTYGRVQVTLPMPVKESMLNWQKVSGMGKAEFLRTALMIGAVKLANDVRAKKPDEGYFSKEDGLNILQPVART